METTTDAELRDALGFATYPSPIITGLVAHRGMEVTHMAAGVIDFSLVYEPRKLMVRRASVIEVLQQVVNAKLEEKDATLADLAAEFAGALETALEPLGMAVMLRVASPIGKAFDAVAVVRGTFIGNPAYLTAWPT